MKVKVAATQMTCSWELEDNINKAKNIIKNAASQGANIILLQDGINTETIPYTRFALKSYVRLKCEWIFRADSVRLK